MRARATLDRTCPLGLTSRSTQIAQANTEIELELFELHQSSTNFSIHELANYVEPQEDGT